GESAGDGGIAAQGPGTADRDRTGERAVDRQGAAADRGRAGVGVGPAQRRGSGRALGQALRAGEDRTDRAPLCLEGVGAGEDARRAGDAAARQRDRVQRVVASTYTEGRPVDVEPGAAVDRVRERTTVQLQGATADRL